MTKVVTLTTDMPIQVSSQLEVEARRSAGPVIVRSIPLAMFVDVHERQCQNNHGGQSLDRIRQRGGFGASEALAVLSCLHWDHTNLIKDAHAHYMLYSIIAAFNRGGLLAEREASPNDALRDIAAERQRQVETEGYDPAHDDEHDRDLALPRAAACYALAGTGGNGPFWINPGLVPAQVWPYRWEWKPYDRRHNLVRAGALIVAEIERVDRAAAREG